MSDLLFEKVFERATSQQAYDFQVRLATAQELPALVDIPTGLGKTAALILAWLWRRLFAEKQIRLATPCRLVYCLPMRVLVDQTYSAVVDWLVRLGLLAGKATWADDRRRLFQYQVKPEQEELPADGWARNQGLSGTPVAVHLLMGGEVPTDWALWPDREAILIGTQDMLLSRALNRGYASSRARWPAEFGLLNNDCLWVLDEVQLMGNGLTTTAQLDAFRYGGKQSAGLGCYGPCRFVWMSATLQPQWLETVDHPRPTDAPFSLTVQEKQDHVGKAGRRLHAKKVLKRATSSSADQAAALAREVLIAHQAANAEEADPILTLVVVNTVERAVALHKELSRLAVGQKRTEEPLLIHSRFRAPDRQRQVERLFASRPPEGRIVVSTQVVEAGVDISAKVLFTELAPWASLVQRFGRCNRQGEYPEATAFWVDVVEKHFPPYLPEDLLVARILLEESKLEKVGPMALEACLRTQAPEAVQQLFAQRPTHLLRRKDLLELFDTTPDLAGNDIDISRYIRETNDHDVHVFWRAIPQDKTPEDVDATPGRREELCPVPIGEFHKFLKGTNRVWRWDFLDGQWVAAWAGQVIPGQTFLIACDAGGYSTTTGWHGRKSEVEEIMASPVAIQLSGDSTDDDAPSAVSGWQSIAEHTVKAITQLEEILKRLHADLPDEAIRLAMAWHDRGKAHPAFFTKLTEEARRSAQAIEAVSQAGGIAKAPPRCWRRSDYARWDPTDGRRRHFRHELASALAVLLAPAALVPEDLRNLVAYLVAAHHGKVRMSIRSLPDEFRPDNAVARFARGIWEGDILPATKLGPALIAPEVALCLEPMELGLSNDGESSWAERMLVLRNDPHFGPFRLAFLEAVLRAADRWASIGAQPQKEPIDA
jgi:CRISPR-associated endonuclease/helicase Cas3